MSYQLIEKLQGEVDFYKIEFESLMQKYDQINKKLFEKESTDHFLSCDTVKIKGLQL